MNKKRRGSPQCVKGTNVNGRPRMLRALLVVLVVAVVAMVLLCLLIGARRASKWLKQARSNKASLHTHAHLFVYTGGRSMGVAQ